MRRSLTITCRLTLCALSCLIGAAHAQAAFWLVPAGPRAPSEIATTLARAGVPSDLGAVTAGLNGAFPIRNLPRLVDLESGLVRLLEAGALGGVSFEKNGELRTLAELLALPGVVIVVDIDAPAGAVLQLVSADGSVDSRPLDADQRVLLGEAPCAAGYAPVSFASGTRCEDVDECSAGLDDCDAHASCDDTEGGYVCSCDDGYEGDGRDCEALPEGGGEAGSGGSGGGDSSGGGEGGSDGGAASGDGGRAGEDAGVTDRDAGGRDDDRSDGGGRDGGAEAGDRDGGGGCSCDVAGLEPGALANPVLVSLAWLLRRRRRAARV